MAIHYKLGLIVFELSLIISSMFLVTWYTTSAQQADGIVINLAGRQCMLFQLADELNKMVSYFKIE